MIHPYDRAERRKANAQKQKDKKASGFKRIAKDQIRDWETKNELSEATDIRSPLGYT